VASAVPPTGQGQMNVKGRSGQGLAWARLKPSAVAAPPKITVLRRMSGVSCVRAS
jgi:hypothetical protein